MSAPRIVIVDTETVSLDADLGLVWEIALICREPDGDAGYLWHVRPSHLGSADPNSVRFSDYYARCQVAARRPGSAMRLASPKLAKGKRQATSTGAVASEVASLLSGAIITGAVPDFDARNLRAWLAANGQCLAAHYHLQDVETMALGYLRGLRAAGRDVEIPEPPYKSEALSLALGVDPAGFRRHEALEDCRWVRAQLDVILGAPS